MNSTATDAGAPGGSGQANQQNPEPAQEARTGVAGLADLIRETARRVARSARSTPGRLSGMTVALVMLAVVVAVVGAILVEQREDTTEGLTEHRQPLAAAAQQLYGALSDADVTVARSFLYTGDEPRSVRQRYTNDLAEAGTALARAATNAATVPAAAEQVAILNRQLPVYTALVESARSSNEQGNAGASTYLREASDLMRSRILPAARELYNINTARLSAEQEEATGFPWALSTLVLVLLGALIATQIYLKRKTNRVFNVGLVVASGAVVVMLLWGAAAITVQTVLVDSGSRNTEQTHLLVKARITALRARADEMFMLVARDDAGYQQEFTELATRLAGPQRHAGLLLRAHTSASEHGSSEHLAVAMDAARSWLGVHDVVRKLAESGSYDKAVGLAIDASDSGSSTVTFGRLDDRLAEAMDAATRRFHEDTSSASAALTLLTPGVVVLSAVAALGSTVGLRDRLREYR